MAISGGRGVGVGVGEGVQVRVRVGVLVGGVVAVGERVGVGEEANKDPLVGVRVSNFERGPVSGEGKQPPRIKRVKQRIQSLKIFNVFLAGS